MNVLFVFIALVAAFTEAKEEPFSIGLGTLSPSYSQTVGKEKVKVTVQQRDNGVFSYAVGDPQTGSNAYLNWGPAAGNVASGYADPSAAAPISPAGYGSPDSVSQINPSAYANIPGYPSAAYGSGSLSPAQRYGAAGNYGGSPYGSGSLSPAQGYGAAGNYGGSSPGLSGFFGGSIGGHDSFAAPGPVSPSGLHGGSGLESARKPEENSGQVLPAGFSYHGTEGQAFLRQGGESPNFLVSEENESARGPAERSFHTNLGSGGQRAGGVLVNGLVGYGPGGPRGGLPARGFAERQFSGAQREHGGHSVDDVPPYTG